MDVQATGFLSPKISVREPGSESDSAVFTPGWTGRGWVVFGSGPRYRLRHTDFWGSQWSFETADGAACHTRRHSRFLQEGGAAMVSPSAAGLPESPVLLLLIWYVRLLMHADTEGGAVVAAARQNMPHPSVPGGSDIFSPARCGGCSYDPAKIVGAVYPRRHDCLEAGTGDGIFHVGNRPPGGTRPAAWWPWISSRKCWIVETAGGPTRDYRTRIEIRLAQADSMGVSDVRRQGRFRAGVCDGA